MTPAIKTGLTAIAIFLSLNTANAEGGPQPPADLSKVLQWEGSWEGPATMTMEGKTYQFSYHADFRKAADGNGLTMEEGFSHPELGTLTGTNLIGYNANDKKIHWFSVDNFGTAHEHLGVWKSPAHFYMEAIETQQKKHYVEQIDLVVKDRDHLEFSLVATLGGKPVTKINVLFTRKS